MLCILQPKKNLFSFSESSHSVIRPPNRRRRTLYSSTVFNLLNGDAEPHGNQNRTFQPPKANLTSTTKGSGIRVEPFICTIAPFFSLSAPATKASISPLRNPVERRESRMSMHCRNTTHLRTHHKNAASTYAKMKCKSSYRRMYTHYYLNLSDHSLLIR
jgi:hypothetical protein